MSDLAPPAFLLVGSARSGTSLLQRLVAELDGVHVPPETHVLTASWSQLARSRWPLTGGALCGVLDRVADHAEADVQTAAVRDALGDVATDPARLFAAVVATLGHGADLVGEKTPGHLEWLDVLWARWPNLPVVALVRDPRAVVASYLEVPFGTQAPSAAALRWRLDQRALRRHLRRGRPVHVVRYETLVAAPERVLGTVAVAIGAAGRPRTGLSGPLRDPTESWKARIDEIPDRARAERWRDDLDAEVRDTVGAITAGEAARWGYSLPSNTRHPALDAALVRHAAARAARVAARRRLVTVTLAAVAAEARR